MDSDWRANFISPPLLVNCGALVWIAIVRFFICGQVKFIFQSFRGCLWCGVMLRVNKSWPSGAGINECHCTGAKHYSIITRRQFSDHRILILRRGFACFSFKHIWWLRTPYFQFPAINVKPGSKFMQHDIVLGATFGTAPATSRKDKAVLSHVTQRKEI